MEGKKEEKKIVVKSEKEEECCGDGSCGEGGGHGHGHGGHGHHGGCGCGCCCCGPRGGHGGFWKGLLAGIVVMAVLWGVCWMGKCHMKSGGCGTHGGGMMMQSCPVTPEMPAAPAKK